MQLIMELYLATVSCATIALFYFLFFSVLPKRRTRSKARLAPEPAGAWPIIGHLPMLSEANLPHIALGVLADKYGPAFMLRLGLHKALVVSSSEVAEECFTTNDRVFATRPSSVAMKIMGYDYAVFAFGPYGSYWREARKLATVELLSGYRLELLKHIRISEVSTCINELYQIWQANRNDGHDSVLVEMKQWFSDLTLNVIVGMIAGKRYFRASDSDKQDDSEGRRLQKAIKDFFRLAGLFIVSDTIPCLGWLDFQGHVKAMKRTARELDNIMERWLEEHKQHKPADVRKGHGDFMNVMLSILEGTQVYQYDADIVNKAISLNMILGGADTTMITLTWALSLLLNNQHVLKKAQDEIDTIIGKNKLVEESDIEKLVYLQAIVKETLRLYPAAPLAAHHEAMADCTVAGYHVPAGTRLIPNLSKIQRDPRLWSNPDKFQPERFLTTKVNVDFRGRNFELIPFGCGRRSCPGISFGLQVIHLTLSRLLQAFHCETLFNTGVDMTESAGLTNVKATHLEVLITPRLTANLY